MTNLVDWLAFWLIIGGSSFVVVFAMSALTAFAAAFLSAFWAAFKETRGLTRQTRDE